MFFFSPTFCIYDTLSFDPIIDLLNKRLVYWLTATNYVDNLQLLLQLSQISSHKYN